VTAPARLLLLETNVVIFLNRGGPIGHAIDARFQRSGDGWPANRVWTSLLVRQTPYSSRLA